MLRRLVSAARARLTPVALDDSEFDPEFYRASYPDLAALRNPRRLARHFQMFGRAEGRLGNARAAAAAAAAVDLVVHDTPPDFDARVYRALHADLAYMDDDQATEHFVNYGQTEGRPYYNFDADIYRELYFPAQLTSNEQLAEDYRTRGLREGRIASGRAYMRKLGLTGGAWVERLRLDEFRMLNWAWAGNVKTKLEAIDAVLANGGEHLAPLALDVQFDPMFYRERHVDAMGSDAELYRGWLLEGIDAGEPGAPVEALRQLGLSLAEFPEAFDWAAYARREALEVDRWRALTHLVELGPTRRKPVPMTSHDPVAFLNALAATFTKRKPAVAIALYEQARAAGSTEPGPTQALADVYAQEGDWRRALDRYASVARSPSADVWTFVNGARAALHLAEHPAAFALLADGRDRVVGHPQFRLAVAEAIDAEFERAGLQARELFGLGYAQEARTIAADAVARAARRWRELDPLGAPLPVGCERRVVVLANTDLRQCTHYRVEQKAQLLDQLGVNYAIFSVKDGIEPFLAALPGAAAAIFYRLPAFPANIRAIEVATAMGVPTYYDIDDLLFTPDYPEPFETYADTTPEEYVWLQYGQPLFDAAIRLCDYALASTSALAAHMAPRVKTGRAFVVPNGLDDRNTPLLTQPPTRARRGDDLMIFYGSGTKAHNSDFMDLARTGLIAAFQRHPQVKLMIVGHLTLDTELERFADRIVRVGWTANIDDYWSLLAEADINLAVLGRYPTTDAKSEIKWLEAAVFSIPSIVSDTDRYCEVLEPGVDALIASSREAWTAALERLIVDAEARRAIGRAARDKAARTYGLEANAQTLRAALAPAFERPVGAPATPNRRRRVLLVNLFFPPQTLGGATRVARDNLDYFLDHVDDHDFEFAVATSDLHWHVPGQLRVDEYRGAPVFRMSTPAEVNMEWRAYNPDLEHTFGDILDAWAPDFVHFHCVQRLTIATLEACIRRRIPYFVTAHDAWYISDFHFLTDLRGQVRPACEALPLAPPWPATIGQALARRRRLTAALDAAEGVFGVSETFTGLYREFGFTQTRTIANGVPPLQAEVRHAASASGRVRLAHIGSQTSFKGYFLTEAVLRQNRFANIELIVVEHSRYGGAERREIWGATLVRFVGKTPQERMHELYAEIDVLVAPSLWPESFGLVSREALLAGLWVIASDRGAMGEDVIPGVNGWVVDVSSPAALTSAFAEIDADPARYRVSPPPTPMRTSDDQARDLLAVYADAPQHPTRPPPPLAPLAERGAQALSASWRGPLRSRPPADRANRPTWPA